MIIKNILIYLCIVALGYGFYLLFVGYLSFYLLMIILFFPLVSLILLLGNKRHSCLSFVKDNDTCIQEQELPIQIKKEGASLGYCRIELFQKKHLLKEDINDINISYPHCGGFPLTIGKYKQYDILNIFYLKKTSLDTLYLTVLPKSIDYDFTFIQSTLPQSSDETYSTTQKGDDPTEIFDIHEYHEGDSLKRIHWKLSSKHQKLLIKENAMPVQQKIIIQCLFEEQDEINDLIFQYLHTFCEYLLQNHYTFILANQVIQYEEQYMKALSQLLWTKKDVNCHTKSLYQYFIDKKGIHFIKR